MKYLVVNIVSSYFSEVFLTNTLAFHTTISMAVIESPGPGQPKTKILVAKTVLNFFSKLFPPNALAYYTMV